MQTQEIPAFVRMLEVVAYRAIGNDPMATGRMIGLILLAIRQGRQPEARMMRSNLRLRFAQVVEKARSAVEAFVASFPQQRLIIDPNDVANFSLVPVDKADRDRYYARVIADPSDRYVDAALGMAMRSYAAARILRHGLPDHGAWTTADLAKVIEQQEEVAPQACDYVPIIAESRAAKRAAIDRRDRARIERLVALADGTADAEKQARRDRLNNLRRMKPDKRRKTVADKATKRPMSRFQMLADAAVHTIGAINRRLGPAADVVEDVAADGAADGMVLKH